MLSNVEGRFVLRNANETSSTGNYLDCQFWMYYCSETINIPCEAPHFTFPHG